MTNHDFLNNPLSRKEKLYGTAWLLFELLLFPTVLQQLNRLLPTPVPPAGVNFLFFCVNFAVTLFLLRKYLLNQLKLAKDNLETVLQTVMVGFVAYWMLNFLVCCLIFAVDPEFSNINDNAIAKLAAENFPIMLFGIVILVPVAEESLYRGVIFRGIYDYSPALAWILSAGLFALLHIFRYTGSVSPSRLLLCFIQYLPAGLCLGAAYRLSGSILSPILIHAAVNLVGMMSMR